ncbi:MAG: quinol:electron acceptor oxidoreductase subunit ActD [Acidobacteriota bacterium]
MTEKIIATFDTIDEAVAVARQLKREGLPESAITLMSSEPIHDYGSSDESRSRIGGFAIAGGIAGAAAAVALTVLVSKQVGLVTGGMPVVAPWPFGIIVFEMAALGSILSTLGRLIYEARLGHRLSDYDEVIFDGRVALLVECADEESLRVVKRLLPDPDSAK